MTTVFPARRLATFAALAVAAILAACAAEPPAPPPPPPPPPPVALSPKVIEMASAYRIYVSRAGAISPQFTDGASVAEGVRTGAAYEPQQLLRGAIAYGAVAALQDPAFVAGVRTYAGDAEQRRNVAYEIMKDPAYVVALSGSSSAAGLVRTALGEDGKKLLVQGRLVKQAAYDVQRSAWSKGYVAAPETRLAQAKQLSTAPLLGDVSETARLTQASIGAGPLGLTGDAVAPPYTPVVVRSMAVAALAALGYGDDASLAQVMPILTEVNSASCFNMSKLNLYQCLAVAKPHYEDVFCLGVHILQDTGQCLLKSAGMPAPIEVATKPLTVAATTPVSKTAAATPRPKTR